MDYFILLWILISHIESNLDKKTNYNELERITGYSIAHLRDVFLRNTNYSIARYIVKRKVENAAFELVHTEKSLMEISLDYGFNNVNTFTRAFRRCTGINPGEFRKAQPMVGKKALCTGVYGISILDGKYNLNTKKTIKKRKEANIMNKKSFQEQVILYSVPKVGYGVYGCTPLPICLTACAKFLGKDVDYSYVITASGAGLRLTWDTSQWNAGNVGVTFAYDTEEKIYETSLSCISDRYSMLWRNSETTKEEFKNFIIANISRGNPVIALGIIGPPEACIITGYRESGNTLLGWNFFQDIPDFGGNVEKDESGYFISKDWWDNHDTILLMGIGEIKDKLFSLKQILQNAIAVLSGRMEGDFAKGILAYEKWKDAILSDKEFDNITKSQLALKLMCNIDALDTVFDGRSKAAYFFSTISETCSNHEKQLNQLTKYFKNSCMAIHEVFKMFGGSVSCERGEEQMQIFAKKSTRESISEYIDIAKENDKQALAIMKQIYLELL